MAQKILNTKIREAYDTEANWMKHNPVLLAGQLAFSSDKYGKYKIGDGVAKWSQLQYMTLGWNDITGKPSSFTPSSHTHDDRYFTETEATNKFSPKEGSASLSKLASTITLGAGDAATILQNGSTYQQKIEISDNATSGDAVFGFYQSGDSGKNFNKLMTINDDGNVVANKFTGALAGNASSASSVPWSGVSGKPSTFPPSTHKHPASQITGLPTKLPNPYALTVKGNGALINTYDGSGAKEINITPAVIGAATSGHTHSQYAPTSHNHSADNITSGVLPISRGGTGGADRKSAMSGLAYLGGNVTGGKANDTRAFWEGKGTGYAWFSSGNQINSQPSTYGYLITICSGSEIHQEWWTQSTGTHYYRGVNSSATAMPAWTRIYDANSIIPVTSGGTGANTYSAALKNLVINGAVSGSAVPTDTNWYLCSDTADSSGTPVRRPMSSLWSYIKGKTDANYLKLSGTANSANMLNANAGSSTQPVYFTGGKPVACTYTLGKSVPSNAVFTDTNTWRPVQNNLTSTSTSDALSAYQGKVLKDLIDGKASSNHSHDTGICTIQEKSNAGTRYVKIAELVCNRTYHRLNQQLIFASRERAVLLNVKAISGNNTIFTASIDYVPISENSHLIINNLYAGLVNISSTQNRIEIWYKQVQWGESLRIIPLGRNVEGCVLTFKNYYSTDAGSTSAPTFTKTIPINSVIRWENVVGRPSTFTPSSHSHTIANITNLQSALNGKASTSHSHSNYATTTNLGLANQRIDAHEKELGVHKTLIDGKAATSHTHNAINDFSNGKATGISPNTFVTPTTAVDYDIVVTNTNPFGNKFVVMRKIDFINHVISKVPLKAITNAQIDSLASL